jgi:ABC-type sugar transport system permease subunit
MAFYAYNPLRPDDVRWVGLDNFERIFDDPLFWESFQQALVWTGWSIVLQTLFGVGLALLLHISLPGIAVFRGLLLFPYIVPTVVIALNWRWIFNSEIGIVNYALLSLGLIDQNIAWLSTPNMAMTSAVLLNVWKYTPFVVICVLARLQTIPTELYDAAKVDGAGAWRRFTDITLPMLKEVLVVVIVFRTIWTFNKFEEIYLLTRGGPGTSTFNLAVYAFEEGMANLRLGVAAATGVIMIAMLLVGTVIYVRVSGFGQDEKTP